MEGSPAHIDAPAARVSARAGMALLLVAAASAVVLLCNLGAMPLWGSEGRWAVISRAMLRSGDAFRPWMGSSLYWDKPLLSYWQVLPAARLDGAVDEFTVRLPSALWAIVALVLTFDLARRWHGERAAALSAMVLASSLGFVFWGRNAQVEMTNAALILVVLWIFERHRGDASDRWLYAVAIVAALGANMKGLPVYGAPLVCVLLVSLVERDWSWVPRTATIARAALLSTALYLAFPALESLVVGSADPFRLVWQENVLRFFRPFDHTDPIWTYPVRIFDLFAPWSVLLPAAIARELPAFRRRSAPFPEALLLACGILIFFTLSGSRRPYYILPILPFLSIAIGALLDGHAEGGLPPFWRRWVDWFGRVCGAILILPLVAYPAALLLGAKLPLDVSGLGWATLLLALTGTAAIASSRRGSALGLAASLLAAWLVYSTAIVPWAGALPGLRSEVAALRAQQRPCAFLGMSDERFLFYLDAPCEEWFDERAAHAWARERGGFIVTQDALFPAAWKQIGESKRWRAFVALDVEPPPSSAAHTAPVHRDDE
jgi:4-amino-4-deoxy-L-arabinose transferase-like glycosyltransferase